ncbi:hypothetical protein GCM10028806_24120 [Spirosoma terrae]|uniref:Uncharacterized protein n=1 Tax=Spirosoma terrae TaxID=1968276 RepID=A0A6L9L7H1_9BACT|nr:hypothetical protein [Spirosoma terrae]NDU94278.1 hypothetical protein [Spirosoma terrae]
MYSSAYEITKASALPFVAKVILSSDFLSVIVELRKTPSLGLPRKNILYFSASSFTAQQVEEAYNRIKKEYLDRKNGKAIAIHRLVD